MVIKALFVNACFEFVNGHGIARKEVFSLN